MEQISIKDLLKNDGDKIKIIDEINLTELEKVMQNQYELLASRKVSTPRIIIPIKNNDGEETNQISPITDIKINSSEDLITHIDELSTILYRDLGPYLPERAYQMALVYLLKEIIITECELFPEFVIPIHYRGKEISSRRLDIAIHFKKEDKYILIEIKHSPWIGIYYKHYIFNQMAEYLSAFPENAIGVMVNFPTNRSRYQPRSVHVIKTTNI